MRKIVLTVLLVLFVTTCIGCHKAAPKPEEVSGYDPGEEYISFWVHTIEDTDEGRCYRQAVDEFNEKYNGKYFVDIEFIPRNDSGGGYSDKINASVMSGDLPDVLTVDGPNVSAYAANGIIQPLATLSEEEKGKYLDSIIDQGTYQGQLYALGAMTSTVGLYYNKDILDEAGISIPDQDHPWTFSQFIDVLEKLKPIMAQKDGYALDMTFPVGEATIYYYAPFIWSNGGDFVDESGLTVKNIFSSDKNAAVINYFKRLVEDGYMSKVPIDKLFESGRAAFKFDGHWEVNNLYKSYPNIHFGVAPYVVSDQWKGERYTPTGSWTFAVSANSKHAEAATELVKWMSGKETGAKLWQQAKCMPSTYQAFAENEDFKEDENYKALYEQLIKYSHPRPKTPVYPLVSSSFRQALEDGAITGMDIKDDLVSLEKGIVNRLERYGRSK